MSEVAHFVLGDLFRFIGALIIMALFFDGLATLVIALRGGQPKSLLTRILGGGSDARDGAPHADAQS